MFLITGILAALLSRSTTGKGQWWMRQWLMASLYPVLSLAEAQPGANTVAVLQRIGLTATAIEQLLADGVVVQA